MSTTPVTDTRVTVSDRPVPNQSVVAELGGVGDDGPRIDWQPASWPDTLPGQPA